MSKLCMLCYQSSLFCFSCIAIVENVPLFIIGSHALAVYVASLSLVDVALKGMMSARLSSQKIMD